ncbi:glycosyl transferase family 1 [Actinobaculum suis]|uniref:glycosyltransferase family 4 protein n=1 Tax=Actinobaculum suis TaxID=1657 RepID=UPI00066FF9E6|nr:glycosyltransferase family 4 protein [Actinobaculum suis]KMY23032.1 glycosyl transferase family 1 [Actinobaculum suis]
MAKIAIVTLDTFTDRMAGPAIRVWEMAKYLAQKHTVRALSFSEVTREGDGFELRATSVPAFREDLGTPDVVIVQGYLLQTFPWLGEQEFKLVVDLYDPLHLESLEVEKHRPLRDREFAFTHAADELARQIQVGDFFLCASPMQRHLWLGEMVALGRVQPKVYDADPTLKRLIDYAPFGISEQAPVPTQHAIRGKIDGITQASKVIIWGGGIYNWFDPLTVIRAVAQARHEIPDLHLVFMGAKHPNPDVPEMRMVGQARQLAQEIDPAGEFIHFQESWVPYEQRQNFLCDADIGISAHFENIETEFSFRTRILDYLWCGLPMISTVGDFFADRIQRADLGRTVAYEDVQGMAEAIVAMLNNPEQLQAYKNNVAKEAKNFTWSRTLQALDKFCEAPYFATDRVTENGERLVPDRANPESVVPRRTLRSLARRGLESVRGQGIRPTLRHVRAYVHKVVARWRR